MNTKPLRLYTILFCFALARSSPVDNRIDPSPPNLDTLKFFAVVTRHGSRSPLKTFPRDPYPFRNRTFWPNGPNELTNLGKLQLYHTGQYLKSKYYGFVDDIYDPNHSVITYNPYNRDYMSSACLSAGLYPPVGSQVWDTALLWQPVVQNVRDFDICDLAFNDECPKFKALQKKELDTFNADSYKYKDLLNMLSKNLGANITKLSDLFDIYDTFHMQEQNGYILPDWTKEVYPDTIKPFALKIFSKRFTGNKELIQLGAGPELKYISDMLTKKASGDKQFSQKKFYVEAAHDCSLISLLRALGNKDELLEIQTAAYLVFELHCEGKNCTVQAYYHRTSYDQNPETINIDGCPSPCSLDNFNNFVGSIYPPDWTKACQLNDDDSKYPKYSVILDAS